VRRFGAAVYGIVLLAGCGPKHAQAVTSVPITVTSARAERFSATTELAGTLNATHAVTLGAASAGRIVAVNVRVGDPVSAGEALAQVDAAAYSAQLTGARAGASAATDSERAASAQVLAAQSRLKLAQTTASRMEQLYAQGAISHQQEDETQANLAAATAALAAARAGRAAASGLSAQAQAGVEAATVPLRNATIAAPFDGVITQKFVEPGAVVGPGSPVVALQDTSDLELEVALPEDQVGTLAAGTPLHVRVDSLGGALLDARVRAIVPSENPALRSAMLRVTVAPHPGLLPGMFARVTVPAAMQRGIGVPLAALVTRAGQAGVFVIDGTSASFVPVQSGIIDHGRVQVYGLTAGTHIAASNLAQLTDGTRVSVSNP
jgi:multidrug efflux pump subunit AcrA (membrane-fusion protein)